MALVGPSGCGKTTLLNVAAGWLTPTAGIVERAASMRMVFQQDGLFPWRTVAEITERLIEARPAASPAGP